MGNLLLPIYNRAEYESCIMNMITKLLLMRVTLADDNNLDWCVCGVSSIFAEYGNSKYRWRLNKKIVEKGK